MAHSISFLNMKGGVGKTTMAVNTAYYLSMKKKYKTLLIDLDPQYNATQYLVDIEKNQDYVNGSKPTVFDIIMMQGVGYRSILNGSKKTHEKEDVTLDEVKREIWSGHGKLDLIPGTLHLINLEMAGRGLEHRLQNFVKKIEDAYDFIIIDCPPTFSIFLLSGILASERYLVPVRPDPLSMLGIPLLEEVINYYHRIYGQVSEPLGVIFTMVRRTNLMDEVREAVKQTSVGERYVFESFCRLSKCYADASKNHIPLFEDWYARYHGYDNEMNKIIDELLLILEE